MRTDLPPNADESLDYASTIETLKLLEGEEVVIFIECGPGEPTGQPDGAVMSSRIQAKGILRHYDYGDWAQGFALGDGARVLLYEGDFVTGHLTTHNEVDLFSVSVDLAQVKFSLGNYHETDEFHLCP